MAQAPSGSRCCGIKVFSLSASLPCPYPTLWKLGMQLALTQGCRRDPQQCLMRSLGGPCCSGLPGQHERTTTLNAAQRCVGAASLRCPVATVLLTLNSPLAESREPQMRTIQALSHKQAFLGPLTDSSARHQHIATSKSQSLAPNLKSCSLPCL